MNFHKTISDISLYDADVGSSYAQSGTRFCTYYNCIFVCVLIFYHLICLWWTLPTSLSLCSLSLCSVVLIPIDDISIIQSSLVHQETSTHIPTIINLFQAEAKAILTVDDVVRKLIVAGMWTSLANLSSWIQHDHESLQVLKRFLQHFWAKMEMWKVEVITKYSLFCQHFYTLGHSNELAVPEKLRENKQNGLHNSNSWLRERVWLGFLILGASVHLKKIFTYFMTGR